MAITISGENNNDKILAQDGVIDQISGINIVGLITASHINVGSNIQLGNAGIVTATTFVGNLTGNVNSTSPLLLQTGGSERFRITGNNELGIAGANYGSSGQVLTSGGSGSAVSWTTPTTVAITSIATDGANRVLTSDGDGTLTAESGFTATTSTIEFAGNMFRIGDTEGSGATFEHHGASGASYNGGSLTIEAGSPQVGVGVNKNAGTLLLKSGMSTGTGNAGVVEVWANKEFGSTSGTAYSQERVADFTNPGGTATFRITDDDDDFCKIAVDSNTTISTSSSGGAGNLTLDVQGNIILDSDSGTIDFKDDGVFLARLSATGLSFNTNTGAGIQFEGATSNSYETSLNVVDPTADRTINLPDASGTVALTSDIPDKTVSTGSFISKQVKVTLSQANCNSLHTIPQELIPAQGADTVIVPAGGILMVDRGGAQNNHLADLNFHYADKEPGTYAQTSLFHIRRFMYGNTTDIVYSLGEISGFEISQNLTDCVNKAVEVSVDSALTSNSMTSIRIYLTYHVIDVS